MLLTVQLLTPSSMAQMDLVGGQLIAVGPTAEKRNERFEASAEAEASHFGGNRDVHSSEASPSARNPGLLHRPPRDESETPNECCIVSKPWVARIREHLFTVIASPSEKALKLKKKIFPDPPDSPSHYTHNLVVSCIRAATEADNRVGDSIQTFPRVVRSRLAALGAKDFDSLEFGPRSLSSTKDIALAGRGESLGNGNSPFRGLVVRYDVLQASISFDGDPNAQVWRNMFLGPSNSLTHSARTPIVNYRWCWRDQEKCLYRV